MPIPNILQTTIAYEICEREWSLFNVDWEEHDDENRDISSLEEIDALIRRTTENIPEDIEHKLTSLSPENLAKVVLMDWVDRLGEERTAVNHLQLKTKQVSRIFYVEVLSPPFGMV